MPNRDEVGRRLVRALQEKARRSNKELAALGGLQAIIAVRLRPQSHAVVDAFRDLALSLSETRTLFEVTGPNDWLMHAAVRDLHQLRGLILDRLTRLPEVAEVQTSTIYQRTTNPRFGTTRRSDQDEPASAEQRLPAAQLRGQALG